MAHPQAAILPPSLSETGFLPNLLGIAEKDLAGYSEHFFVVKCIEQRRQKMLLNPHVAVEEHDDVIFRRAKTSVRAASETEVVIERQQSDRGKMLADECRAAIL